MSEDLIIKVSVGMPAGLYLQEFGSQVTSFFNSPAYLMGSSLYTKAFRDVDVRVILTDSMYEHLELGDPNYPRENKRWTSLCLAYSALGKHLTGLPIDFQIWQFSKAESLLKGPRIILKRAEN